MKIIFDMRFADTQSGIGRYSLSLLKGLTELNDMNIELLAIAQPANYELVKQIGIKTLNVNYSPRALSNTIRLPRLLKHYKADVYHCPDGFSPFFKVDCSSVITLHDMIPFHAAGMLHKSVKSKFLSLWHLWLKRQCSLNHKIITVSKQSQRDIVCCCNVDATKVVIIPHGIPRCPTALTSTQRVPTELLFVGRHDPYKNLVGLIYAFHELRERNIEAHLTVVGPCDLRYNKAKKLCTYLKLEDYVNFLGVVEQDTLEKLYSRVTALIAPSYCEGFNLPLVEAMSWGLPVVASDIPVHREVLGKFAVFFDPTDAKDIANKIISILENSSEQKRLAVEGRQYAQKFSLLTMASAHLDLYKELIEQN